MKRQGVAGTMRGVGHSKTTFSLRSAVIVATDRVLGICLLFVVSTLTGPHFVSADGLARFTEEPQSAVVAHHNPLTLRCSVDPSSARVAWLFNGEPLDPGSHRGLHPEGTNLYFARFHHGPRDGGGKGSEGEYRCTATTAAGTVVSAPAVVSRPVLRRFPTSNDVVTEVEEGGYVTIPCSAPYSVPPAVVRVMAPSGRLLNQSSDKVHVLQSGSAVLSSVQTQDSGNYTCVAFNTVSGHNRSAHHSVQLRVKPRSYGAPGKETQLVDSSPVTVESREGDSVTLECPVSGRGQPDLSWTRAYGQLPSAHSIGPFGNLHIPSVSLRDSGAYLCTTPTGEKRQVLLEVHRPPQVTREPGDGRVRVQEGDGVRLSCRGGGLPAPSVTWFFNGRVRSTAKSAGEMHVLSIQEVKRTDAGVYVCELANSLGHASAVIHLSVLQTLSPSSDIPAEDSTIVGNSREVIPANSADFDNQRNFRLEVANNNKNRNGRKRKNGKKKGRRKKNRKKGRQRKAKLVPPQAPTITRLSDTSVLVQWSVPDNDGLPISLFRVQYKEIKPSRGQWQTVEDDISASSQRYKVTRLKAGGTYTFRMAAVYSNNDNRNSPNSRRFHLTSNPHPETRPPSSSPRVVEAKPIIYKNILAIGIKWQYLPSDASSIDGFYIFYKPYGSKSDYKKETLREASIRNHVLTALSPDTEYSIKMKCFNSVGASGFSNMVVMRTLPLKGQSSATLPPPLVPPRETETESPPASRREAGGLDQPVILGIVLGIMLLLLVVFIAMCWWKQRQQKRHSRSPESCMKFQDQAHRIYVDSLHKKHPNGGPYPLNGLNGLALANGHGPPSDLQHLSLDTMSPMDHLHHRSHSPSFYSSKPFPGNGMVGNGTIPGYDHDNHSDNNFNSISRSVTSDHMTSSQGLPPNGMHTIPTSQYSHRNRDYNPHTHPHPYSHSRTSLSSFTPASHQSHHDDSGSQSDDPESPDESEPLARENPQFLRNPSPSYLYSPSQGHVYSSRDNGVKGLFDSRRCYGYEGSFDSMSGPGGTREEGSGYSPWSMGVEFSSSSHAGKHKRRRKRTSQGEREHTMKDQATNTDLSSNGEEGAIEALFTKSSNSSVSTASNDSVPDATVIPPHCPPLLSPAVGTQPSTSL